MKTLQEMTFDDIRRLLEDAVLVEQYGASARAAGMGNQVWVTDVIPFGNEFVYYFGDIVYKRSFQIDPEDLAVTLGNDRVEVERETYWVPTGGSQESYSFSESTGVAVWSGPIFKADNYVDRNLEFTEEDLEKIIENFTNPVPLMLEHTNTPLTGKIGFLKRIWRVGEWLHGEIEVPTLFHEFAKDLERKVSIGLDSTLRRISEISWVMFPRVADAKVFTEKALALFSQPEFAGKRNSTKDAQRIQSIHDLALELGAKPAAKAFGSLPTPPASPGQEKPQMKNIQERLLALVTQADSATLSQFGLTVEEVRDLQLKEPQAPADPRFKVMINSLVSAASEKFADTLVAEGKLTPAMRPHAERLFTVALKADGENGEVKFSETDSKLVEGEAVAAVRGLFKEIKPFLKFGQQIPVRDGEGFSDKDALSIDKAEIKKAIGAR